MRVTKNTEMTRDVANLLLHRERKLTSNVYYTTPPVSYKWPPTTVEISIQNNILFSSLRRYTGNVFLNNKLLRINITSRYILYIVILYHCNVSPVFNC